MGNVTEAGTCLLGSVDVETGWCAPGREQGVRLELQAEDVIKHEAEEGDCLAEVEQRQDGSRVRGVIDCTALMKHLLCA